MNALVTGATGTLGRKLLRALSPAVVLVRDPVAAAKLPGTPRAFAWDSSRPVPPEALEGVDVVFHLAGEPVAEGRWTADKKARIRQSRVDGTRAIVDALLRDTSRPRVLVSASAVGLYGSRGDEVLDERAARGDGYLAEVCAAWEAEAQRAASGSVRVVTARIGIVLSAEGGALAKMLPAYRLGLGGPLAGGRQWMPWVHEDDVVGMLLHAAANRSVVGPMNVTSPEPARNRDLSDALGAAVGRPALLPVPRLALRVSLGELADVVLASQRVVPVVARETGYRFREPTLAKAIASVIGDQAGVPRHEAGARA